MPAASGSKGVTENKEENVSYYFTRIYQELRTKQIYAKTLTAFESKSKIKAMSPRHLPRFRLRQQLFGNKDFSTKTRLRNIFKTTNIEVLIKAILESPYKLLQKP